MHIHIHMYKFLSSVLTCSLLLASSPVAAQSLALVDTELAGPQEVDFVLTAYYSPLPGQCCYVKGGLVADKILNGNGTHGADGTPVYVGMVAAPPSYKFGTKVQVPGLGVLEVHDRGGAIQLLEGGKIHRIDVWAGYGEEGLARALSFGVKRVRGMVYPPGSAQPASDFSLDRIAMDFDRLRPYNVIQNGLVDVEPKAGDTSLSVAFLQDHLRALGYLADDASMFFGPKTQAALEGFQRDKGLAIKTDALDPETAAMLMASVRTLGRDMGVPLVSELSSQKDIAAAQRLLRSMGYYKGRTNGLYDQKVKDAIMAFQKESSLIADAASPGAGTIGPVTQSAIASRLRAERSRTIARGILLVKKVRDRLAESDDLVATTTEEGYKGDGVEDIQRFLSDVGFFPADSVNGVFGPMTRQAVAAYQIARGVIPNASAKGAGTVGPITLKTLQKEQIDYAYGQVRGYGWEAL
jgi:peptidoglycan hydrolase-like protein with peptidoglycan-binding domain/3D (Asp-Asp-Asp) domain-containing protein